MSKNNVSQSLLAKLTTETNPKLIQKRNNLGKFIQASKKVSETLSSGLDRNSTQYNAVYYDAKTRFDNLIKLSDAGKAKIESGEITFSEEWLCDNMHINDLDSAVTTMIMAEIASNPGSPEIELSNILKPIKAQLPKYENGILCITSDEDGNIYPEFEEQVIGYSLGSTSEEATANLKNLLDNIQESFKYEIENLKEQIKDVSVPQTNDYEEFSIPNQLQEKLIEQSISAVVPQLIPQLKSWMLSPDGQSSVVATLSAQRYANMLNQYINLLVANNIDTTQPNNPMAITPFGATLLSMVVDKDTKQEVSGVRLLEKILGERAQAALGDHPILLTEFNGDSNLDAQFQNILYNATDQAVLALNSSKNMNNISHYSNYVVDKPIIVKPDNSQDMNNFASNAQQIMNNGLYNKPQEALSYMTNKQPVGQNNLPPQNNVPTLPDDNNSVDEQIKNNTQGYSPLLPQKVDLSINPSDIEI